MDDDDFDFDFEDAWADITEETVVCEYAVPQHIKAVRPRLFCPENFSADVEVQLATICAKLESEAKRKLLAVPACKVTGNLVHIKAMRRNKHGAYVGVFLVCPDCSTG